MRATKPHCEECGRRIEERVGEWKHLLTVIGIQADMDHKAIKAGSVDHWEWQKSK